MAFARAGAIYGPDLAHVHDAGFGGLARDAADWLVATLREAGFDHGLVVDLGCGTGILAERVLRAGYDVLAVDLSEPALEIARRRAPSAEFVRAPALEFELPRCLAVAAVGEVLGYAGPAPGPSDELARLFARVASALEPGGILAFDLAGPDRDSEPRRSWWEGEGWLVCMSAEQTSRGRELRRRIVTFRVQPEGWRRSDEEHRLRLHAPGEVLADLTAAGFEASEVAGYGSTGPALPGLHFYRAHI